MSRGLQSACTTKRVSGARALGRKGVETSQLALARCVEYWAESARGEEPLKNGGSKQNFVANTKFTVTDER